MLPGTEGANIPFFSPDGRWVGFGQAGKIKKISVEGGEAIEVCDSGLNRGGVWCDDDTIVFSPSNASGLVRVPSGGGKPVPLTTLDPAKQERTHRWPALLPGGEVAFTVAVRFPFPRSRFAWSRLGIAALVILPAVHFWYGWAVTAGPAFLRRPLVRLRDDGGLVDPSRCGDRGWVRRATIGR